MLVVHVRVRLAPRLLELVLRYLLVEHLLEELRQVLLSQLVVQLAPVRLDDVAAAGGRAVGECVVLRELDGVLEDLFVFGGRIFHTNKSLGGRGVSLIPGPLPVVLLHDLVEVASAVLLPLRHHLLQELSKLLLNLSCFGLELLAALVQTLSQRATLIKIKSLSLNF